MKGKSERIAAFVGLAMFQYRGLKLSRLVQALWGVFWIGVAALHVYLFIKRLVTGQWTGGLDQARLILALAGAAYGVYGTVKIGHVVGWLERSPRKVLAAILLLLVAHLGVSPGTLGETLRSPASPGLTYVVLAAPLALALALFGFAASKARRGLEKHRIPIPQPIPELRRGRAVDIPFDLRRRPPPGR